jgi:ATPase subunit of ABC transporter with duplicated ATPase domains
MEVERDRALLQITQMQEGYSYLVEQHDQLETALREQREQFQAEIAALKKSLQFFQSETGRWRWAAASSHTKIQSVMHILAGTADVLRAPDGDATPDAVL